MMFRSLCLVVKVLRAWILLSAVQPIFAGYIWNESINMEAAEKDLIGPRFDVIIKEIDANVGETVLLPCTVRNLGDKVVSWIRTKDLSILTSGVFTFSADNRFESVYSTDADFWGLRIRGVKISDTGQYECQVNSDPKMNLAVNLSVSDLKQPAGMSYKYSHVARIKSAREVYVRIGSSITLTCEVTSPSPSSSKSSASSLATNPQSLDLFQLRKSRVQWLHKGKEITSESDRGGISVDTDYREAKITSRLRVSMVTFADEGFYTCTQTFTKSDSIKLFVFEGEHSEAMQRDASYSSSGTIHQKIFYLILIKTLVNKCI